MSYFDELEYELLENAAVDRALKRAINAGGFLNDSRYDELDDLLLELTPSDDTSDVNDANQPPKIAVESISVLVKPYTFPVVGDVVNKLDAGNLAKRMSELVVAWKKHNDYMLIRDEYCELAIALNYEGSLAPAFRPITKKPIIKGKQNPPDMLAHQDRLVIECHWLRCRHEYVLPRDIEFQELFDVDVPFSFSLAADFAAKGWRSKHRADEAFYLTNRQRCQLFSMRGDIILGRHNAAKDSSGRGDNRVPPKNVKLRKALREWCGDDKRIIPEQQAYENLWLARELLGNGASMREIAELGGFISGAIPLSERTVRDKLQRLDKRMQVVG